MKRALVASLVIAAVAAQAQIVLPRRPFLPPAEKTEIVRGLVLVKFSPGKASMIAAGQLKQAIVPEGRFLNRIAKSGWTLWRVPETTDTRALAKTLMSRSDVGYAQPVNRVYSLYEPPDDPDYHATETRPDYFFQNDETGEGGPFRRTWHLDEIYADLGWEQHPNQWFTHLTKPANTPLVAIIDTGCDLNHPDFMNAGGTTTDISGGGQLDLTQSVQFSFGAVDPNENAEDVNGHGTHVAGLALAAGNNGPFSQEVNNGVVGTGYPAKGVILRVFDDDDFANDADAAAAIYHAANIGADVVNLSLGTENYSQLFQDAVTYAFQKGTLVICATNEAGDEGGDQGPIYPAACSGALGVNSNGPDRVKASYAGFGDYIDVAAPGGDIVISPAFDWYKLQLIWSTSMREPGSLSSVGMFPPYEQNYSYLMGTSMACPIVSGAAALYYSKFGLDQQDGYANVRGYRALEYSAESINGANHGSWEPLHGYGCLDMNALMQDINARGATVGGIEGQVYASSTPIPNAQVRVQNVNGGLTFSTTTNEHGYYRFEGLVPGTYNMLAIASGHTRAKRQIVKAGSDTTGVDFWTGTFFLDDTAPTAQRLEILDVTDSSVQLKHWGYDTESQIDAVHFRIGTTSGGDDVLADTLIVPDGAIVTLSGLTLRGGRHYLQVRYTNGAGLAATKIVHFDRAVDTLDLQITPNRVVGGEGATGTVITNSMGVDTQVALSDNTSAVSTPASVTVPAGQTSAEFPIATALVTGTYTRQVTAAIGAISRSANITLTPGLKSLVLTPTTVEGGQPATGTVALYANAPSGGTTVALSDNTSAISTPTSATVAGGVASADFLISTSPVSANATRLVSATLATVTRSAALTLTPRILVSALTLDPSTVQGGQTSTATVTLSKPAPPGGIVVSLTDNSSAVSTPASVTVAAGSTSATFVVSTSAVSGTTYTRQIKATYNTSSRSANITITP